MFDRKDSKFRSYWPMLRRACLLLTLALFGAVGARAQTLDELTIITENYPPYNFQKDGELRGMAVDLMVEMLKRSGSTLGRSSIKLWPWARGYRQVLRKNGTVLFSTTRTAQREKLFAWVGPISPTTIALIARKDRGIELRDVAAAKKFKIGVIIDDVGEQLLLKEGFDVRNLDRVSGSDVTLLSIKKLAMGRIDLWSYESNVAMWEIKDKGFDPGDFEVVHILGGGELYYAFNPGTAPELIARMQRALDAIKEDGTYRDIVARYVK